MDNVSFQTEFIHKRKEKKGGNKEKERGKERRKLREKKGRSQEKKESVI